LLARCSEMGRVNPSARLQAEALLDESDSDLDRD
jgi:hypothetical protein